MLKLSEIPAEHLVSHDALINYMIDRKVNTIINDFGYGMEYELCEIEENMSIFYEFIELYNHFNLLGINIEHIKNDVLKNKNKYKIFGGYQDTRDNDEDLAITPYLGFVHQKDKTFGVSFTWLYWSLFVAIGKNLPKSYPKFKKYIPTKN